MALKRRDLSTEDRVADLFNESSSRVSVNTKEKKILTTFSIEPSFKGALESQFDEMGLGWASGLRFALKYFQKNFKFNTEDESE